MEGGCNGGRVADVAVGTGGIAAFANGWKGGLLWGAAGGGTEDPVSSIDVGDWSKAHTYTNEQTRLPSKLARLLEKGGGNQWKKANLFLSSFTTSDGSRYAGSCMCERDLLAHREVRWQAASGGMWRHLAASGAGS
jgi:hypothetical protein